MKNLLKYFIAIYFLILNQHPGYSQGCGNMNIQLESEIGSTCNFMVMTMLHDTQDRPYLYVANKEAGLKIYDITDVSSPMLVATVATSLYNSLDVMNVSQNGNYLYLAIGNSFTNPQQGGMAIVDVTNPLSPLVTDFYVVPSSNSGGGIVKAEGNYAYLGAMQNGLVVLNISDKSNILFVSQFIPDINFPDANNPNPALYNARGMEVKNSIVYLCYDAGGVRIINCTDKLNPKQTGKYSNPLLIGKPRAYNNLILDESLLFVSFDYCGMEILNVADTSNISEISWWNPYNCPNNNWFSSPVHANEIQYDKNCKRIFLATGKSDMYVLDVSNTSHPDSCNFYGGVSNNIGTWGVGTYKNQIYLSYICAIIPFGSNWTGVKILTYLPCTTGLSEIKPENDFKLFPIPSGDQLTIETQNTLIDFKKSKISITNLLGQCIDVPSIISRNNQIIFDTSKLKEGSYFLRVTAKDNSITKKFIKTE